MNDNQSRTEKMAETTLSYMDSQAAVWNGNLITVAKRDALEDKLDEINAIELIQETNTTGNAVEKEANKLAMAQAAFVICKALQVFAKDTGNAVLAEEINFELSNLSRVKDTDAEIRCQLIHDRALTNAVALAAYGVTLPGITTLKGLILAFHNSLGKPKAAESVTAAATHDLDVAFRALIQILHELDGMIDMLRFTQATFWQGYQTARKRDDSGVRHQSVQVHLFDKQTHALLGQGSVIIDPIRIEKKVSKRSVATFFDSETGIGSFDVVGKAEFYQPATVHNVVVEEGKVARVEIELEKIV